MGVRLVAFEPPLAQLGADMRIADVQGGREVMPAEPGTGEHVVMVATHSKRVQPLRHLRPALLVRVAQRNQKVPAGGEPSANRQVRSPARPKRVGELLVQGVD